VTDEQTDKQMDIAIDQSPCLSSEDLIIVGLDFRFVRSAR